MLAATQYEQNEFDLSCSFRGVGMRRLGWEELVSYNYKEQRQDMCSEFKSCKTIALGASFLPSLLFPTVKVKEFKMGTCSEPKEFSEESKGTI